MNDADAAIVGEDAKTTDSRKPVPLRMKALLGLLALLGVAFSVNAAHIYTLENELRTIAEEKERGERIRGERAGVELETASIVTATKQYLIYGDVHGKIEVFLKKNGNTDRLIGMDYFLSRKDGEWSQTESSVCTDETCQTRGTAAFADQ